MDEDSSHPDRVRAEHPSYSSKPQHERTASLSLGMAGAIENAPAEINGDAGGQEEPSITQPDPFAEQVNNVVNSEVSGSYFEIYVYAENMLRLVCKHFSTDLNRVLPPQRCVNAAA